ncbi:helix-turn-helix domain-containing protein, partial [[Clostridium] scindens]
MEDLYKHIEGLGREHGYKNMTVLCKAAGVPRSTMSELNNGRSKDLSKPNAQKFADILGITLDEVYGEETKKAPTQEDEREITFDDFTFAMQNESKDLTEADKQILLSMAKQLNDAR